MATFFSKLLGGRGTAKSLQGTDFQGTGLKSLPMTICQVLIAGYSSDYSIDLPNRYVQVNDGEPDEQLSNGMFRAFESLVAVSFGYVFFTRRCYKWLLL